MPQLNKYQMRPAFGWGPGVTQRKHVAEIFAKQPIMLNDVVVRAFTANARTCELDAQGRILLPQSLIRYGGLTKECAIIGVGNHIEIWNAEKWDDICNSTLDSLNGIAEDLPEMLG